jgi:hypothetical protein
MTEARSVRSGLFAFQKEPMMPAKKDKDQPEAMKTEMEETTVPVNVGMGKDEMAKAETQNRQVGVDDSKAIRETLHDAAEDMSTTVDIPVQHEAGTDLPEAAKAAIDAEKDKDDPKLSGSTRAAMPGTPGDDPLSDGGVHTVTINGKTYTWKDGEEGSVPAEAVAVYERAKEANTP